MTEGCSQLDMLEQWITSKQTATLQDMYGYTDMSAKIWSRVRELAMDTSPGSLIARKAEMIYLIGRSRAESILIIKTDEPMK